MPYQQCSRTVMDNIADPDIRFDAQGVCNYVYEYEAAAREGLFEGAAGERRLQETVAAIKKAGKGKKYDCLIGLSGGVDSTYVAWLVKSHGLRPLAVHLDNGWDSELAVHNIESTVRTLDIDLATLVIDWNEFRDIQCAYLKASVVDIEVVSDHAIFATMYQLANKYGIQYVLSGTNIVTEQIMPPSWLYRKMDYENLRNIHNKFGQVRLRTYPRMDFKLFLYYQLFLRLKTVSILNFVKYEKTAVKEFISKELGWRDYGGKHYESTFTKFYQAYILPTKFSIDKRKAHLSTLICSGQLTRDEALRQLEVPLYLDDDLKRDMAYVVKKLGLTQREFDGIMSDQPRSHAEFGTDQRKKESYMNLLHRTKGFREFFKSKKLE